MRQFNQIFCKQESPKDLHSVRQPLPVATLATGGRILRPYLCSAQLVGAHGIRGALRFRLLGNDPEGFAERTQFHLLSPSEEYLHPVQVQVQSLPPHPVLQIADIHTREEAEALRWHYLATARTEAPLPEGRYYVCDLIGCSVWLEDENQLLGTLREILQHTSQDVYVVSRPGKKDLLFPLVEGTLCSVDLAGGVLRVRLPEGLIEIYD